MCSVITSLSNRLQTIINVSLLLLQLITLSAYTGIVNSKTMLMEISKSIYPDSEYLMNSVFAEVLLSYPVLIIIVVVFFLSIYKEFKIKPKANRIFINLAVLVFVSLIYGLASYQIYSPIGE